MVCQTIMYFYELCEILIDVLPPQGVVLINGKQIDVGAESFNIFSLFDTVRNEILLSQKLFSIGITHDAALRDLTKISEKDDEGEDAGESGLADGPLRVNIRKGGKGKEKRDAI